MQIAIELDTVGKTYRPRNQPSISAVAGISLQIPAGQVLAIFGGPGAGKTTLVKLIGGLLAPTTGSVRIFGLDVIRQRRAAMCHVGTVLAGAWHVSWHRTVWDALLADGRRRGLPGTVLEPRAASLLDALELLAQSDRPVRRCRPATWTRLAIATALLPDPPILVLDEPMLGLDGPAAKILMARIAALAHEREKTLVVTSRDLSTVREQCDRVVLLNQGELVFDRPATALRALGHEALYRITVKGHLDGDWSDWFDGLRITPTDDGETILTGPIADQAALHGLLMKVRDLGLPLLSLSHVEPEIGDVLGLLRSSAGPAERVTKERTAR